MTGSGNGGNGSGTGTSSSAWYRFKREISRRTDVETLLTKRRGSLPVEVLTVNYTGKFLFLLLIN